MIRSTSRFLPLGSILTSESGQGICEQVFKVLGNDVVGVLRIYGR